MHIVDMLVSLDRSVQEEVVEWSEPVRLEPQEIVLPVKEEFSEDIIKDEDLPVLQVVAGLCRGRQDCSLGADV